MHFICSHDYDLGVGRPSNVVSVGWGGGGVNGAEKRARHPPQMFCPGFQPGIDQNISECARQIGKIDMAWEAVLDLYNHPPDPAPCSPPRQGTPPPQGGITSNQNANADHDIKPSQT